LLSVYGPAGQEQAVARHLSDLLRPHADETRTDALGNLITIRRGKPGGKRILISAHMDHIGFIAIDADKQGFVRVANAGYIFVPHSQGQHVMFGNGVRGVVYAEQDITGNPEMQHLFVDIGAQSRDEALAKVAIGDVAVYAPLVSALGEHRLAAPAMDDRAGCALGAWLLLNAPQGPNELVVLFSAQEEVGGRGAKVAAFALEPDIGLALDVTDTGDTPGVKPKMAVELGKGPAIKVRDSNLIASPLVRDALVAAAKEAGVPYQMEVLTIGGTDAGLIQLARGGVPSGALSIPTRYIHSAAETIDMRDLEQCGALLAAFAARSFD
jgi:endoglucanase